LQAYSASQNCELINATFIKAMKITVADNILKSAVVLYSENPRHRNESFQAYLGILRFSGRTLTISK